MATLKKLEGDITALKERNRRVESDKAWEVSWTRRLVIAAATYVVAGIWLVVIHDMYPWLKAFVPAGGYLLSTLTISAAKKRWIKNL
ncbi:hypothetical protein HZB01_03335 [Candidatus Woesearchaeota archaeon]|nr:hypothetical protein [Candidatus Woesearchaeota archaeon]